MRYFQFSVFLSCLIFSFVVHALPFSKINLNTATAEQLVHVIKGIGIKRAQAIVAYRKEHGLFHDVHELSQVKGIGETFVNKNLTQLEAIFVFG